MPSDKELPALASERVGGMTQGALNQRLVDRWPVLAQHLRDALTTEGEEPLAAHVETLRVVALCTCGDDFCHSFYTAPPPEGSYGIGHRTVSLDPPWPGMLNLDVVDADIVYVEVLHMVAASETPCDPFLHPKMT